MISFHFSPDERSNLQALVPSDTMPIPGFYEKTRNIQKMYSPQGLTKARRLIGVSSLDTAAEAAFATPSAMDEEVDGIGSLRT